MIPVKDIEDGKRIKTLFDSLKKEDKNLVLGYLSALNDKQLQDEPEKTEMVTI
ncbi:MAG: hypothetical protein K1W25_11715 [Lachnospiraceae bacterium]